MSSYWVLDTFIGSSLGILYNVWVIFISNSKLVPGFPLLSLYPALCPVFKLYFINPSSPACATGTVLGVQPGIRARLTCTRVTPLADWLSLSRQLSVSSRLSFGHWALYPLHFSTPEFSLAWACAHLADALIIPLGPYVKLSSCVCPEDPLCHHLTPLLLVICPSPLPQWSQSLGGEDVTTMSHVELRIWQLLILCSLLSCRSANRSFSDGSWEAHQSMGVTVTKSHFKTLST